MVNRRPIWNIKMSSLFIPNNDNIKSKFIYKNMNIMKRITKAEEAEVLYKDRGLLCLPTGIGVKICIDRFIKIKYSEAHCTRVWLQHIKAFTTPLSCQICPNRQRYPAREISASFKTILLSRTLLSKHKIIMSKSHSHDKGGPQLLLSLNMSSPSMSQWKSVRIRCYSNCYTVPVAVKMERGVVGIF